MKKSHILSIVLICFSFYSCKKDSKFIENSIFGNSKNKLIELNFNLKDSLLIKDIENKIEFDLCKFEGVVNTFFYIEETKIKIPLFFYKDCPNFYGGCNKDDIQIIMNSNNEILIDNQVAKNEEQFTNIVFELNNKYQNEYSKKRINFFIEWNNGEWDKMAMKKLMKNLLIGINKFYDKYSLKLYSKELKYCTPKEKNELLKKFKNNIGIYPYYINNFQPPPPPPKLQETENNHFMFTE